MSWQNIEKIPEEDQYCEYKIVITCRGWFSPLDGKPQFAPDDRFAPIAQITAWKPLESTQTKEEAFKEIEELRKKAPKDEPQNA